jgi:hypothetical protein
MDPTREAGMPYASPTFRSQFDVGTSDHRQYQAAAAWESLSMLDGYQATTQNVNEQIQMEVNAERHLVGSLTSSYPFAKGGLCKKTISIQIENSTQHLISYYTLDDVRSGRLRTPSSLPELASMAISPIFLTKTAFRFPPSITFGPDGVPRYAGEESMDTGQRRAEQDMSSGDGTSSGSETRPQHKSAHHTRSGSTNSNQFGHRARASTSVNVPASFMTTSMSQPLLRHPPLPHQIGGNGSLAAIRRSSDDALHATSAVHDQLTRVPLHASGAISDFDTYQNPSTGIAAQPRSPTSMPSTPFAAQTPMDPSVFMAFAQGVASPTVPGSRATYPEVRPHTASSSFGRPYSDQGPIFHTSAQENLRRAVASSGWEPMPPSSYHGSSNALHSASTDLLSRQSTVLQQQYVSNQAFVNDFDSTSRHPGINPAGHVANSQQHWGQQHSVDNEHFLVSLNMQQRAAQTASHSGPHQWQPHYDPSTHQGNLQQQTDVDAFEQITALSQPAAQPLQTADMYYQQRVLPSGLPGPPQ